MILSTVIWVLSALAGAVVVGAEKHTVRFDNRCGYGTPHLLKNGAILSQGEEYVSDGSLDSTIAYLQTGNCNLNGEGCTLVEMTLVNPTCPGCGSSVDISLIPPLAFSVSTSFSYFNGCDGQGAVCNSENCTTAFYIPSDNHVQVQCEENNVDLLISFCAEGSSTYVKVDEVVTPPSLSVGAAATRPKTAVMGSTASVPQHPSATSSSHPSATTAASKKKCKKSRSQRRDSVAAKRSESFLKFHRRHAKNRLGSGH
ncbi:hypothetical protein NP233_g11001 [Leucocoprinus birnbaumii]|uniref:Glycopeptide n=1 Tax=Leucocoprinus birnbaumii TaxID=56174 RepID=A0AAD5VHB8_9AGAR|nr:hypothetical protein NP233_g11001 [Leucocoprinus birnbaumii]